MGLGHRHGGDEGKELLVRARAGDAGAFADLVSLHSGLVRGVAIRTLGPQEAQDACQDVWLRVWLSMDGFRGESSFSTWLYRVAINTCLTEHRRVARRRSMETAGQQMHLPMTEDDGREDPPRVLAEKERRREVSLRVLETLSGMRNEHRSAFVLRHALGLSYREVADVLGVPSGTAKGWAHRGKTTARTTALAAGTIDRQTPFRPADLAEQESRSAG